MRVEISEGRKVVVESGILWGFLRFLEKLGQLAEKIPETTSPYVFDVAGGVLAGGLFIYLLVGTYHLASQELRLIYGVAAALCFCWGGYYIYRSPSHERRRMIISGLVAVVLLAFLGILGRPSLTELIKLVSSN